ncbi:ATP-binding protein [Burkholderia sp. WSM2230]|uniref:ATP-binding protein n=1 Tax=Burkholderia sp. WSM2230 TaxID=944435 RepID=UPI0004264521|nr:ATP-binding protein [Burkholderia sp. WSM2230]
MTSIRRWLLGWLICGLAAASAVAAFGIFHTAREEASELFDYELRTVALSLPKNIETAEAVDPKKGPQFESISDDLILIEIWDQSGALVYHSRQAPVLARMPEGIRTIERSEMHWRVLGLQQPDRFVQVAQPVSVRDALALRLALHTLWPLAVLMPVTVALVLFVVGRGLAPIGALSRLLGTRSLDSLEPIHLDDKVPVEIHPLVDALNDLLHRLNVASTAQRTFIADAAHELRSPLAALKLQLQAAEKNGTLKGDGQTLERIDRRLNRLIRLVQQLLTLAHEDAESASAGTVVSLRKIGEQAVGDLSLLADDKQIDLGLESRSSVTDDDACNVLADSHGVSVLLNNLIDNAIRYTPEGGTVDVVLIRSGDRYGFEVTDTGPGIPEEDLNRVLDRFYRGQHTKGTGSGLGLAIAARIAQRQQLVLSLRNNADGRGLTASVSGFLKVG